MAQQKSATNWSAATDMDTVRRRAAGRKRYNALRTFRAALRRRKLVGLLSVHGGLITRGTQARLARELGVSPATISRDVAALMQQWQQWQRDGCPMFGSRRSGQLATGYDELPEEPAR